MKRNLKSISASNDLSYYTDEKNIGNQSLVRETIWFFENTDAADVFKPLEFLNLFEKQFQFVKLNFNNGEKVLSHLKTLPLSDREKHILYCFILKWTGGYPVNNLDADFNATLKLIESEFLAYPDYSDERHFCKSDMDRQKQFMRLGEALTLGIRYGMSANELYEAFDNPGQTKQKVYFNFYELFEDAVKNGSIEQPENAHEFIIQRSSYKIQFNEWLLETKGWNCREDDNYKKLLTKEHWLEFLHYRTRFEAESQKMFERERQSWQIKQQPINNEDDVFKHIMERTEIHDFLSVPAPDVLRENAFLHDENDLPIDCNIYHPKYGYKGFETTTKELILTSFQPVTVYQDERTGKYIYSQFYLPVLCTADEISFTNKDNKAVKKVNWTQTSQKRLAESEQDFATICQRELRVQKLIEASETKRHFYLELIAHTSELIELHKRRSSYKEGRDINILALADRFINYLNELINESENTVAELGTPEVKPTITAYALMHVYLAMFGGQGVTQQNKQELIRKYGYSSAAQLRNDFTLYQNREKRLDLNTTNRKSANTHLERYNKILPLLEKLNQKAFEEAKKDFEQLEKMYKKHY